MIDSKLFKKMYDEIDEKVQKIRVLPMLRMQERDYDGWEYDEYNGKEVIVVSSSYYMSGCGEDQSSFEIPLSEINNSVEWFEKKFKDEIDENLRLIEKNKQIEKERVAKNRERIREEKVKSDMATYRRIKKKLEKHNME